MRLKIGALALTVIALSAAVGASAFTTGSVDRATTIDVVSDDKGLLALEDGTSGGLVVMASDGTLGIDFTKGGASGVNPEATYELGNTADPTNQTAFNISNHDAETHDLTVKYTGVDGAATGDGTSNIQFLVYDSTGTKVATVSEESTSATVSSVASGDTLYVVMSIDTTGLTNSTSLSGTLTVSA